MDDVSKSTERVVEEPEEVLAILREASTLYGKLNSCAARQRSLISNDDMGPLLALLAERRKLSAELAVISDRLTPVRRDWERHRQSFSATMREEADRLLSGIELTLRRAIDSDEEDVRLLRARKLTVSRALSSTHSTQRAMSAYRTESSGGARMDKLDETQ